MSSELVFVTGASGFVGSVIVDEALKGGYRGRAAVRREAAAQLLKEHFGPAHGDKFETVLVSDLTRPESYDGKLDGVSYIIHVASPLAPQSTNWKKDHIDPAVNGTVSILEAATKIPSIKKVVITSSIAALYPLQGQPDDIVIHEDGAKSVTADPNADFPSPFAAYHASKILADQASTHFLEQRKPNYAIVTIHPSYIFGRNPIQRSAADLSGTNQLLYLSLTSTAPTVPSHGIHVLDVAEAHLRALRPEIPTGAKYFVTAPQFSWNEAAAFVKEKYPKVPVQLDPVPEGTWLIDTSRAQKDLGFDSFRSWKQFVSDVVEQQLEFA